MLSERYMPLGGQLQRDAALGRIACYLSDAVQPLHTLIITANILDDWTLLGLLLSCNAAQLLFKETAAADCCAYLKMLYWGPSSSARQLMQLNQLSSMQRFQVVAEETAHNHGGTTDTHRRVPAAGAQGCRQQRNSDGKVA